jgi:hypothetical protein
MNIASLNKEQGRVSTALYSIARRHQHYAKKPGAKKRLWVPLAYRGVKPEAVTEENDRFKRGHRPNKYRPKMSPKFAASPAKIAHDKKIAKIMGAKEKEGRLLGLHQEFVRLTKEYKQEFSSDPVVEMGNLGDHDFGDWKKEKQALMQTLMDHLRTVFDDVHQADKPTEWAQIEETDALFRSLCRITRSMIVLGTELYIDEEQKIAEYSVLAESALRDLVKFQSERALLVDATKKWSKQARSIANTTLRSPESLDELETSSRTFSVQRWIQSFLGSFPGTTTEEKSAEKVQSGPVFDEAGMGHRDPNLGATQSLFRLVILNMASAVQKDDDVPEDELSRSKRQKIYAATAKRMLDLMEAMPPSWVPEPPIVDQVLAVLSRVGTLESAKKCLRILKKHPKKHPSFNQLRFSTVLEAFVEAAKHEKSAKRREEIVKHAITALNERWNEDTNLPRHRVERINLCSIVLNCMSVAGISSSPEMCDDADSLIKRALGGGPYYKLKGRISSSQGRVDAQALHLVHFLVQIYASSGEEVRLEGAQRMLEYMKAKDTEGVGRFIVFPNRDTFNSVLKGLLRRHEAKRAEPVDKESAQKDIDYSMGLLDFMLASKEIGCWPNEVTFALLFRLLSATRIEDGGEHAEELLSKLEIRRSFPGSHDVKINLSAYNRTLACWLEDTKSSSGEGVCERALRLLDKLEVQSTPLLLSHLEARAVAAQRIPIYDIDLQPNRITYKLVMRICAEVKDPVERQQALKLAEDVYQRMVDRGITPGTGTEHLLKRCQSLLVDSIEEEMEIVDSIEETEIVDSIEEEIERDNADADQETQQDGFDQQTLSNEVSDEVVESVKLSH